MSSSNLSSKKLIDTSKPPRWPGITRNFKNMQVFGKFKRHQHPSKEKETLIEEIPSTSSKSSSEPSQRSNMGVEKKDLGFASLSDYNEPILKSQQINQDIIHGIIMPYWIFEDEKVKQPVLLKLKKISFIDNELVLPFSLYNSNTRNCFLFKLGSINFHGKIMSLGDNVEELKATFRRNLSENPSWKGLPKMVRMNHRICEFSHTPLSDKNKQPDYKILTQSEAEKIFNANSGEKLDPNSPRNGSPLKSSKSIEPGKNKRTQSEIDQRSSDEENGEENSIGDHLTRKNCSQRISKKEGESKIMTKQKRLKNDGIEVDKPRIDGIMERINSQVDEIIHKKNIISNSETNGQVLIAIINILDDLREFLDQKQQNEHDSANLVPEKDSTYKLSQKNQIFIEGLIQLDLDLYETATKHAKPNNPASFAYCLVKFSFPRSYIQDVVLGKRFYEKNEFDEMFKKKEEEENCKYPLSFIWGFKDPYNERMEGHFDYKLGNERLKAFINHTFRKSNILSYSKEAESQVRRRIMKELCSLNAEILKKRAKESIDDQESDSGKSQVSLMMDKDWFEKN